MSSEYTWNMNVICVDAEEETLKLYKKVLSNSSNQLEPSITTKWSSVSQDQNYAVYPAMSGKAAIRTALEAKTNAQDIAVGFFDLSMQGEMDGANTIGEIKRIFPSLLCAIVTDETSIDVSADVRNSFESQDEWLYIKKPFSEEELMQTACNLVVSWNLRREQILAMERIKKQQNNVQRVLFITPSLFHTQTHEELCATTIKEACQIAGSNHAFLAMREEGQMLFKEGSGKFNVHTEEEKAQVIKILTTPSMWDKGCLLTISLAENPLGILFIDDLSSQSQGTEMLELFITQVASAFENIERQLEKEKQKAHEQELLIGTKIQRSLLPKERPESEDIQLYGLMQSAKEIGGDYFDYFYREIPPDKVTDDIFVSVGDVAGKGVAAGLIMSEVRSFIRALNPFYSSTKEIMDQLSRLLEKDIKGTGRFMSLLLMLWDSKNKYFKFTSAGHEHIIHYIAKEGKCRVSKAGGVVLGLKHSLVSTHLKEQKLTMDPGDVIILFTDGTTESMKNNDSNEMFGLDRMVKLTVEYAKLPVDKILNNIYNDIFVFIEDGEQSDDITMVAIKRK
ncbi:SpoIIE family protein phosphatase [Candidatus Uabimicrobium sp. HlEnr_7]|uniref:SpoIIE family protein phosphatase n=1 Tax=Candidatus Uabimicrobium helgolandensis TaxID=3095367 RepID=UPI003556B8FF